MNPANPLQKFFRQPKIYVTLPSKGLFYEPGAFIGDYNNVPVFAMTGMDEIVYKTPDALYSGEATAKVIESCCPFVKNAKVMPSIDIDALIIAIRIATFGDKLSVSQKCTACETENDYDIDLKGMLDYFNNLKFINTVVINDSLTIKIRPLQYDEMSYFSIENFKLQKTLYQTVEMADAEKQKQLDQIYKDLSELQLQLFLTAVEQVQTPDGNVDNKEFIEDWLRNTDRDSYNSIKLKLEQNKETWSMPKQQIKCAACGHEDHVNVTLDQSNFFV
jgi:hypothetical protein